MFALLGFGFVIFCVGFILIRNLWVFKQQNKLNRCENRVYLLNKYISYDEMMYKFWIWDVEKLKKQDKA